ncbi:carbohydrate-binding protein [Flavicella sediminum]|uniref:hypothetical protein n=1 Tax=Flavicella sediminum TaxID=2585141 RepID=UPI00111CEA79|nr:hypothetical protein [Flavicella sediminum]
MKTKLQILCFVLITSFTFSCNSETDPIVEEQEEIDGGTDNETDGETDDGTDGETDGGTDESSPAICRDIIQPTPTLIDNNATPVDNKCAVFLEVNGILIFEAENTKSDFGNWIYETSIPGYRGTGYLRYVGPFSGSSPLTYTFKIQNAGIYRFMIRSSKPEGVASDANNDCFIKMEGDFVAGTMDPCLKNYERNSTKTPPLKQNTKFFGTGGLGEFKNAAGQLDLHSVKPWATYEFKAGETYTLTITGRSSQFSMDRILITDLNKYDYSKYNTYAKNAVQSPCLAE